MPVIHFILILLLNWILLEVIIRLIAETGIETDFYGSIRREEVQSLQEAFGLKVVRREGRFHLGWIADPENEHYLVQKKNLEGSWVTLEKLIYGSYLSHEGPGDYRVLSLSKITRQERSLGEVTITSETFYSEKPDQSFPVIVGEWHSLFKPSVAGNYLNDHCLYRDIQGNWRIMGITSHSKGDYKLEHQFAVGVWESFPPKENFHEETPILKGESLAWVPFVVRTEDKYHLFWSPHQLQHMTSRDGISWTNKETVMEKPFHKFFRDGMIVEIAPGQWLLYATGRGRWFSRIDLYQSFDLVHWQYIRPALSSTWGSEKNFVTGSMESPFLIQRDGRYYLSVTYNNESFFLSAILLQIKIFLNRKAYNNTLIFQSQSPYDFGVYREKTRTDSLISRLACHAPVYITLEGEWYVTTCGWPFAATLTEGEVAYAKLNWEGINSNGRNVNKR